jgi:predicted ATPase
MQIIDKVEINYFRSVYSISLKDCNDINIITGANDAGKSNILKALNLFFNNEAEPHSDFDFIRDLNRSREVEARDAKGRMTIWIRVQFNNFLDWQSLPEKFSIKRTWTRYDERPTDNFSADIPATTIGRFLNKLRFHYIPAIRSRETFADLLEELHDTLVQDETLGLRASSQALVDDLQNLTGDMTAEIQAALGIESRVNIPDSLGELFRAFDFSTVFAGHDVPLTLRGDGIQSRHIPFILDYIASKSKQHHIWGYEEPENSLELTKAYEMASDFSENFAKESQIFLTTHSPAFYDIDDISARKWYVENSSEVGLAASSVRTITDLAAIDKSMGLLATITPRIREMHEEFVGLQARFATMSERLQNAESALVYVEGPSDATILNHAKAALGFAQLNLRFESSGGAGNLTKFLKGSAAVRREGFPLIGIYDHDKTGTKEFDSFTINHLVPETDIRVVSRPNKVFAGTLGVPDHVNDVQAAFNALNLTIPVPIEFMFNRELIQEAINVGVMRVNPRITRVADFELPLEVNLDHHLGPHLPVSGRYFAQCVEDDSKIPFANWVITQPAEEFEPFRLILEQLQRTLDWEP